jgi:hypothetical protein
MKRGSPFILAAAGGIALGLACTTGSGGGVTITGGDGPGDPGRGGIRFAVSGEVLALTGYDFPPRSADAPAFVDGWKVTFTRLLVTVANVTLSENPDAVPGDQSQSGGVVARLPGPWAFDLARSDPSYLPGKGSPGELAVPFESINETGRLKTDGTRYAFGFEAARATASAKQVNLDAAAAADYQDMIAKGCVVLYVGHASFKGDKGNPACWPPDRHDFPDEVDFRLCFKSPATYLNCQNPDNDPAKGFPGEEHQRGIALKEDSSVIAQITIHTDHPFWDSVIHDSPVHFDQFAARVSGGGSASVTLEDSIGVDYTGYTDKQGNPLAWRYCIEPSTDAHAKLTGAMRFDPQNVPHAGGPDPAGGLRDYYDFSTYDQSTQGHLNSDGLCAIQRSYPSPF